MRHGAKQSALAVCFLDIGNGLLATGIESGIGHIRACRGRPLHHIKGRLEGRAFNRRSHFKLCGNLVFRNLEHGEHVGIESDSTLRARITHADEILTRLLARLEELALRPVAHELDTGLAFDNHGRSKVPVTAGEVVINIGAKLGHAVEGLLHGIAAQCFRVEIDEGLLVEIRAE